MRIPAAAIAVSCVVVALGGCGSNDQLSSDQVSALKARTAQFSSKLEATSRKVNGCTELARAGQASRFQDCLSNALESFQSQTASLVAYVQGLTSNVEGECKTKLDAWVKVLDDTAASFGKAADEARAGENEKVQATLGQVNEGKISSAGQAASKACTA